MTSPYDPTAMSLVGEETALPIRLRAAVITAATCPECGRLASAVSWVQVLGPFGVGAAEICWCSRGHWWPHVGLGVQ